MVNQCSSLARQQPAAFSGRLAQASSTPRLFTSRVARTARCPAIADDNGTRFGDLQTTKELDFMYLSPEQAMQMAAESEQARQEGLAEYEALKALLLRRTWRFGTFFAGYLLLAVSGEAAFAELVGSAASYGYVLLLFRAVDAIGPDSEIPLKGAELVEPALARNVAKVFAAYRQALKPRLLVPFGLVAACSAWNASFPEYSLGIVEQGCMIGGFLSFKIALIGKVYDDLKPKILTEEELRKEKRPSLVDIGVDDVKLEIKRPSEYRKQQEQQQQQQEQQGEQTKQ